MDVEEIVQIPLTEWQTRILMMKSTVQHHLLQSVNMCSDTMYRFLCEAGVGTLCAEIGFFHFTPHFAQEWQNILCHFLNFVISSLNGVLQSIYTNVQQHAQASTARVSNHTKETNDTKALTFYSTDLLREKSTSQGTSFIDSPNQNILDMELLSEKPTSTDEFYIPSSSEKSTISQDVFYSPFSNENTGQIVLKPPKIVIPVLTKNLSSRPFESWSLIPLRQKPCISHVPKFLTAIPFPCFNRFEIFRSLASAVPCKTKTLNESLETVDVNHTQVVVCCVTKRGQVKKKKKKVCKVTPFYEARTDEKSLLSRRLNEETEAIKLLLFCHFFAKEVLSLSSLFRLLDHILSKIYYEKLVRLVNLNPPIAAKDVNALQVRSLSVINQVKRIFSLLPQNEKQSFLRLEPLSLIALKKFSSFLKEVYDSLLSANIMFLEHFVEDDSDSISPQFVIQDMVKEILRWKVIFLYFQKEIAPNLWRLHTVMQDLWYSYSSGTQKKSKSKKVRLQDYLDTLIKEKGKLCGNLSCQCSSIFCSERILIPAMKEMVAYGDHLFTKHSPEDLILHRQ